MTNTSNICDAGKVARNERMNERVCMWRESFAREKGDAERRRSSVRSERITILPPTSATVQYPELELSAFLVLTNAIGACLHSGLLAIDLENYR